METIVVVDSKKDWPLSDLGVEPVTAQDYLSNPNYQINSNLRVINLCRSHTYQKLGYYVSLVATARGHKPHPSQLCIEDLKSNSMIRMVSQEMDELVQKSLQRVEGDSFVLSVYFGQCIEENCSKLAAFLVKQFPAPLLKARFTRVKDKWTFSNIFPVSINRVEKDHLEFLSSQVKRYLNSPTILRRTKQKTYRYDLAMLVNPKDPNPPSNPEAIRMFQRSAEKFGFNTEILKPEDLGRIAEFDALFIRETTQVNHHTFHFARRAAAQGLVVIDDPNSILRCSNKIYLTELLNKHSLPMPKTTIVTKEDLTRLKKHLEYPFVLKRPDGCFSNAVTLVESKEDFQRYAGEYFVESDLLIAQEFLSSKFDWRIGVFDNRLLYACKYYMVKDHWQIVKKGEGRKKKEEGDAEAVPLANVPARLQALTLKVSGFIGNGLYGIDIKEIDGKFYVIEINDNPNIDAGVEDEVLKERLYDDIIYTMRKRVDSIGSN